MCQLLQGKHDLTGLRRCPFSARHFLYPSRSLAFWHLAAALAVASYSPMEHQTTAATLLAPFATLTTRLHASAAMALSLADMVGGAPCLLVFKRISASLAGACRRSRRAVARISRPRPKSRHC
jgi:hypothetical protein